MTPDPQNPAPQPESPPTAEPNHRRTGKVARLAKAVRDKLNNLILDGLTYNQVISQLGEDGRQLNEDNIGNWKSGGYLDWLKQQACIDEWRAKWEFAHDLIGTENGLNIHQMVNQTMANLVHEAISDLSPDLLNTLFKEKPESILQLIQFFPRLTEAEIQCARHRAEKVRDEIKSIEQKRGKRVIRPETHKEIEQRLNLR